MAKEKEVADRGRTFRGVVAPTGPDGNPKTVNMYIAVAFTTERDNDKDIVTPDCTTLRQLREAIDKLKSDLDWVYQGLERNLAKMRKEHTGA